MPPVETTTATDSFASLDVADRLRWVREQFSGEVVATTSFGAQSVVLLHLLAEHAPEIPIICIDTGYFFPETYRYAEQVQERLGIEVGFHTAAMTPARMENTLGRLWEQGAEGHAAYGRLRKVEPLDRALKEHGARAWISGLRRSHSIERGGRAFVERQNRTTKIYPILDWTDAQVEEHIRHHRLPRHPLVERGFVSIGDWHSTRKLEQGMRPEETRDNGAGRECGLHLDSGTQDFQI